MSEVGETQRDAAAGVADAAKTVATLGLLGAALPLNLGLTGLALLRGAVGVGGRPPEQPPGGRKTILLSGGKMTKALALARAFHRAGHRVVLVESPRYRWTGHRFSRSVDAFHTVPEPDSPDYTRCLLDVVRAEGVDVYVPVSSPLSSRYDALAKAELSEYCEVIHLGPDEIDRVDDKYEFALTAADLELTAPDSHRVVSAGQVAEFDFESSGGSYILKSIAYDPVRRLDLTPLPRPSADETERFAAALPLSDDNPWVMQRFIAGEEFCTHSTVRHGRVTLHCCCRSSAVQLNYENVEIPEIERWVRRFVGAFDLTGQLSFDFIRGEDGRFYAIECNPRTHSAITMFYDHPAVAAAYLDDDAEEARPLPGSRPTYWLYNEAWKALRHPRRAGEVARTIRRGKEAIFDWEDPLPFLMVHHAQVPSLLLGNLRRGASWVRIDFNIGKLVEPGATEVALRVLHLVGSAESDFLCDLSRLYAADCLETVADPERYEHVVAYVTPDRDWRFPEGLGAEAIAAAPPHSVAAAIRLLAALEIDVAVPQMFCRAGMTSYRALLDLLEIPFVGNTAAVMDLAADKQRAKAVVAAAGVDVPAGTVVVGDERPLPRLPVVVKPLDADNSFGVSLVRRPDDLAGALASAREHGERVLVEDYVELGREVRCGVIEVDGRLLPLPLEEYGVDGANPIRRTEDKIASAERGGLALVAKGEPRARIVPREDPATERVWEVARRCHEALGCRHHSLFDFRLDPDGRPWFLEAGLYCSFARQSVITTMAVAAGIPPEELFAGAVRGALVERRERATR